MWDFHRSQETPATKASVRATSRKVTRLPPDEGEAPGPALDTSRSEEGGGGGGT